MKSFQNFCEYLSTLTTIKKEYISVILMTIFVFSFTYLLKVIITKLIHKKMSGREEYVTNQTAKVIINIFTILILLLIWSDFIKNLMTLISVLSAAITIALKDIILNFFCGIYIKVAKPFKVEDRIQIDDIKGDVMNISTLSFDILEVSNSSSNGQSTGIVVTFPTYVIFTKPLKNINKGFKYIWDELTIKLPIGCDLSKNKQEIYKIVNNIEVIKNIPKKMQSIIDAINTENRIYFNKYEPIIYTKIVDNHIELTVRYLMHPKKSRHVESVIWNKIYTAYQNDLIDLYNPN